MNIWLTEEQILELSIKNNTQQLTLILNTLHLLLSTLFKDFFGFNLHHKQTEYSKKKKNEKKLP